MGRGSFLISVVLGLFVAGIAHGVVDGATGCSDILLDQSEALTSDAPLPTNGHPGPDQLAPLANDQMQDLKITLAIKELFPHAQFRGRGAQSLVFTVRSEAGKLTALRIPRVPGRTQSKIDYQDELRNSKIVNDGLGEPAVSEAIAVGTLRNLRIPGEPPTRIPKVPVLASKWVEGRDLGKELGQLGPKCDPRVLANAMLRIAQQVRHVHSRGLVHLDLKPGNILVVGHQGLTLDSRFLLLDLTRSAHVGHLPRSSGNRVFGTPGFMSPNHRAGGEAKFSDDLFALSRTYVLMVVGVPSLVMNDPREEASFRMYQSPYSFLEPESSGQHDLGYQILSTVSYHPWEEIDSLISALEWAVSALTPNSGVDFYEDYYWPQVLQPFLATSPVQASDLIEHAPELRARFSDKARVAKPAGP